MRHEALPACLAAAVLSLAPGCETILPPPPEELDLWADAAAGVDDPKLADLCAAAWEASLRADPIEATYLGDPRYHGEVPRSDRRWVDERLEEIGGFEHGIRSLRGARLSERDGLTLTLLTEELAKERTRLEMDLVAWRVDPLAGPHVQLLNLTSVQPTSTPREREQLVRRWRQFEIWVRDVGRHLERGKRAGVTSPRSAIETCIDQLDAILRTDVFDSPLVAVATGGGRWIDLPPGASVAAVAHEHLGDARRQADLRKVNLHLQDGERLVVGTRVLLPAADDPLSPDERGRFLYDVLMAVEESVYPALTGYRDVLLHSILPGARTDAEPGLTAVPDGARIYRALIHEHTSLPLEECDPKAIHEFGLAEVERIRGEIADLGERVFGTRDVGEIQRRLRNDPAMHFETRDEVAAKAREALYRAKREMPAYFGLLPRAECEVVRIPAHEERDTTIAYYRPPVPDGSLPGRYYVNTYRPETRPRYEAEVLAYHEAIPGHHLQVAIAQELDDVPLFRRHHGSTAFVEGWALYTERLCDEMGLYSGDVDRLGVLSFDAWRACRLVVDTGIHAFAWSRDKAIDFLLHNTLLARNNVENEVDRYIAWPGQALAYKIGQREILALRDRARRVLGGSFDYPAFHDRVLENGAVSLPVLRDRIERWLGGLPSGAAGR